MEIHGVIPMEIHGVIPMEIHGVIPMEINGVQSHNMMCNNNDEQETEKKMRKKKRLVIDNLHYPVELIINIRSAEGIDNPVTLGRHYFALYYIEPAQVFQTRVVRALLDDPFWDEIDFIPIPNRTPQSYGFLNVEIVKLGSDTDPGPSSKMLIVGRARVPLPKQPCRRIVGRFGLVRLDGNGHKALAGYIILAMELRRLWIGQHPCL